MTPATEFPTPPNGAVPPDAGEAGAMLAELRQQMAALEEQLAAVNQRQAALRLALHQVLARFPDVGQTAEPGGAGPPQLQRCAGDVLRVLREVGRPLGALEILEEMAARHLSWRESTVRHVLADLKEEGVVHEGKRPMSYSLAHPA